MNENGRKSFFKTKGFYIASVVCLLAAAVFSWSRVTETLKEKTEELQWEEQATQPQQQKSQSEQLPSSRQSESFETSYEPPMHIESSEQSEPVAVSAQPSEPLYTQPVEAAVAQVFSQGKLVKNDTLDDWRTHNGVDYAADEGTPVLAVLGGEISRVEKDSLWGNVVEQKLDSGYVAIYAGLKDLPDLTIGQRVETGDVVGSVGNSSVIEKTQGAHLHFEVRSGNEYVDPQVLFANPADEE